MLLLYALAYHAAFQDDLSRCEFGVDADADDAQYAKAAESIAKFGLSLMILW